MSEDTRPAALWDARQWVFPLSRELVVQALTGDVSNMKRPVTGTRLERLRALLPLVEVTRTKLGEQASSWWRTEQPTLRWLRPVDAFLVGTYDGALRHAANKATGEHLVPSQTSRSGTRWEVFVATDMLERDVGPFADALSGQGLEELVVRTSAALPKVLPSDAQRLMHLSFTTRPDAAWTALLEEAHAGRLAQRTSYWRATSFRGATLPPDQLQAAALLDWPPPYRVWEDDYSIRGLSARRPWRAVGVGLNAPGLQQLVHRDPWYEVTQRAAR